jgi:hypothetical protein
VLRADRLGLRPVASRTLSVFSGIRTVLTLAFRFFICCRNRGSKLVYPFLEGVAIRKCSVFSNVKLSSEYLLRWYHGSVVFFKNISTANARCSADQ